MLVEFRVKNFRSIKDEQVFSMAKGCGDDLADENWFNPDALATPDLLTSAVIYGANASGKSNLLKAINAMKSIVINSAGKHQKGDKLSVEPFLFDKNNQKKPSEFEVVFVSNSIRYQYGFIADKNMVLEEWLLAYPNAKPQNWFHREYIKSQKEYTWKFGSFLTGRKQVLQEATRSNALFLSTAVQLNNSQLEPVFDWFSRTLKISTLGGWGMGFSASECQNKSKKNEILNFLHAADICISNLKIKHEKFNPESLPPDIPDALKEVMIEQLEDKEIFDIKSVHKNKQGDDVVMDFNDESDGTQKLFSFAGPWLDCLNNGYVLVVDELHDNLHPKLVKFLVNLFHDKETNIKNAQLIFTTHETSILNQEVFRRDQIWFCEKDELQATKLIPLSDFNPRKGRENLESNYLSGRYGALPFIRKIKDVTNELEAKDV